MLGDIFNPIRIKMDLEGTTKADVFEELVETIAASEPKYNRRKMLEAIIQRESKMNTIILPGVAVPHGYYSTVSGVIGAIGFSREGIEYDESDQNPVHLLFLLLMDEKSREQHLQVFARLLELLKSPELAEIRNKENPKELYDLVCCF